MELTGNNERSKSRTSRLHLHDTQIIYLLLPPGHLLSRSARTQDKRPAHCEKFCEFGNTELKTMPGREEYCARDVTRANNEKVSYGA